MAYMVGVPKEVRSVSVYSGDKPVIVFEADPRYGRFDTNVAAKRAFMEAIEAELIGTPDDHIRRHFDAQARNIGMAKVVKVK